MTAPAEQAARPVLLPFTSSKQQPCTGRECTNVIERGDLAAFDAGRGPRPLCTACAGLTDDEETTGAVPGPRQGDVAAGDDVEPRPGTENGVGSAPGPDAGGSEAPDSEDPAPAPDPVDEGRAANAAGQAAGEERAEAPPEGVAVDTPADTAPVAGPVAPRFDHTDPIGPDACRCGDPGRDGSHHTDQPCAHTSAVAEDEPRPLADLSTWADQATGYGTDPKIVAAELIEAVRLGILAGDLRGRQKEIGPSEVGHPCARALGYRLAGTPHTGSEPTPWRQRVGTLVHADNDDHLAADNERCGTRWLTNLRVRTGELYPGRPIDGTLDVFDVLTGTVIDEKVPGATAMKTYGPGRPEAPQYRAQLQLYGRGCLQAGFRPAWVGTLRISPARELSDYLFKVEPFDEQTAVDALSRAGGIARMVDQLGERAPALLPATEHVCHRCPWLRRGSTDLTTGCPGVDKPQPRRASVDDLVG